ncbi:MAG: hypothetical protein WCF85_09170 [Rhodospirillaceae bacterium]
MKLCVLFNDATIVQPGNLLEHTHTILAFERLAPFTRSGLLWTSVDLGRQQTPVQELGCRMDEATESLAAGDRRRRGQAFRATFDRLLALAPPDWPIKRSVAKQVRQQTSGIKQITLRNAGFLEQRKATALLRLIDAAEDRGVSPTRDYLLAQTVRRRDVFDRDDIQRILAVSQAHYFKAGTEAHAAPETGFDACQLYPGPFFTRWLPQIGIDNLPMPEIDTALAFGEMGRRLRVIGVNLEALLGLSAGKLHEIVVTPEWRRVRDVATGPGQSVTATDNGGMTLREAVGNLPRLVTTAGRRSTSSLHVPAVIIPEWRRSVWSAVGTAALADGADARDGAATAIIDLSAHTVAKGARVQMLTRGELALLTLFAVCGAGGLHAGDMMASLDEDDAFRATIPEKPVPRSSDPKAMREDGRLALRNRTDVALHRLEDTLAPLDIRIANQPEDGRYLLEFPGTAGEHGPQVECRVRNSPWDDPGSGPMPVIGKTLSPQHATVVRLLSVNMPHLVPAARIAGELGMAGQVDSGKAISRIINKVNASLSKLLMPWRVFSNRRGGYALVADDPPPGPEGGAGTGADGELS